MNIYTLLFAQFFHVGLLSFGGGYATLPFLYDIGEHFGWYTTKQLTDMLAVASVTPGPVGVNVATYAGFSTSGIFGATIATTAVILPSLIIVFAISGVLDKFKTNKSIKGAIRALKPAGCALLSAVWLKLLFTSNLHLLGVLFLIIFIGSSFVKKMDPLFYLTISAFIGFVLGHFGMIGV